MPTHKIPNIIICIYSLKIPLLSEYFSDPPNYKWYQQLARTLSHKRQPFGLNIHV